MKAPELENPYKFNVWNKVMKTVLVYPRFFEFSSPPLGLAYIASNMRKSGLGADLVDCTFGFTPEKLVSVLREKDPDVIGFSLTTINLRGLKDIIKDIRAFNKDVVIVAGGPHPSSLPRETLRDYDIDIAIVGEGEYTMVDIVKALEKGRDLSRVSGIYYKKGGVIKATKPRPPIEDLDPLPFPARDMLDMESYIKSSIGRSSWTVPRPSTTISGSRGCPGRCTFCAAHLIHGRRIRMRSPQNFVDEIEMLIEKYGLKGLWFNDDSFSVSKKWVMNIFEEFKKRAIDIKWGCNTRVNMVDMELLKAMKDNGCRFISFGVESGVQDVLNKYLKKDVRPEQIESAFRMASKIGIVTQGTFMVGIPGESIEDMEESIEFAKRIEPDSIQVSIATPLPSTELVDIAKKIGRIEITDWEMIDYMWHGVIRTEDFSPQDARRMQKRFLKSFYFRPSYFLTQLRRIRSTQDLTQRIRGFYQLVGGPISPLSFFKKEVS